MSGYYKDDCYDPCHEKEEKCRECECVEDPSIRSLRRQLTRLEGNEVVIIANNFFSIVTGTVSRVNNGTVTLTDATVFGIEAGRVIIALSKINLVVPVTTTVTAANIVSSMRAAGALGRANI